MQQKITAHPNNSIKPVFYFGIALIAAFFIAMPEQAVASEGAGGGLPYESWLGQLRSSVTGPIAFTLSMIGIVAAGATMILGGGDISGFLRTMVLIILVISLLIGAQNMMSTFFGRGAEIAFLGDALINQAKAAVESTGRLT